MQELTSFSEPTKHFAFFTQDDWAEWWEQCAINEAKQPPLSADTLLAMLQAEAPGVIWAVTEGERGKHNEQFMWVAGSYSQGGRIFNVPNIKYWIAGDRKKLVHAIAFQAMKQLHAMTTSVSGQG